MLYLARVVKQLNGGLVVLFGGLVSTSLLFAQSHKPGLPSVVADMDSTRTQYLSDGTVLKQVVSSRFMRDAEGRTRVEQDGRVIINDPILRRVLVLNPAERTAYEAGPDPSAPHGTPSPRQGDTPGMRLMAELGQRTIEGVAVIGKEWVSTIPAGSNFGNDRPIETSFTVWYSEELGLAIRTTVHSPMSGVVETSFRNVLTSVGLEPSLFGIPPDYTLTVR